MKITLPRLLRLGWSRLYNGPGAWLYLGGDLALHAEPVASGWELSLCCRGRFQMRLAAVRSVEGVRRVMRNYGCLEMQT